MLGKIIENVRIASNALMSNKVRSMLTMLGITIGVASVILLTSVGRAVEAFILNEFSSFGSNLVVVFGRMSNEVEQLGADENDLFVPMTQNDLESLENPLNVPDASVVAAAIVFTEPIEYDNELYTPQVVGITPNYLEAYNFGIGIGEP
jgi:putative ABC transport system permease protein